MVDSEFQNVENEDFQIQISRRRRNHSKFLTGREPGTLMRSVNQVKKANPFVTRFDADV